MNPNIEIPMPPRALRAVVGRADAALFDAPDDLKALDGQSEAIYRAVFDFGCGCGRTARQLLKRQPRPERYVGIDINRELIAWCQQHLAPVAPDFIFLHHDVRDYYFNREGSADVLPFPVESQSFSLVVAASVFTHLTESQALQYLHETARILEPGGACYSTWFLFDRRHFPYLSPNSHALYASYEAPSAAVAFDDAWVKETAHAAGLDIIKTTPPDDESAHWRVLMMKG